MEYPVTKVLASRLTGRKKTLQYQVEWQGCDPDDTWYPAEDFKNAATLLDQFHHQYPDAAGPPVRLSEWIRAAAEDRYNGPNEKDNVAVQGETNARRCHLRRHR